MTDDETLDSTSYAWRVCNYVVGGKGSLRTDPENLHRWLNVSISAIGPVPRLNEPHGVVRGVTNRWMMGGDSSFDGAEPNCVAKLGRVWWFADQDDTHDDDPLSKLVAEGSAVNGTEASLLYYGDPPATEYDMLRGEAEIWIEKPGRNCWLEELQYWLFAKNDTCHADERKPRIRALGLEQRALKSRHVTYQGV